MMTSVSLLYVRYFHVLKKKSTHCFFFYSSIISPMLLENKLCYDLRYFPKVTVADKDWNPVCQVPS